MSLFDSNVEEVSETMQKEDELLEVVKRLPQKYRAVIHLFYYEELSIDEMAGLLMEKPSTVRTQLTRARRQLRKMLEEDSDVSGGL